MQRLGILTLKERMQLQSSVARLTWNGRPEVEAVVVA
jgi:hypothetical protein